MEYGSFFHQQQTSAQSAGFARYRWYGGALWVEVEGERKGILQKGM